MIRSVEYFEEAGPVNSDRCLTIAGQLADEGFTDFLTATTTGASGVRLAEALRGRNLNLVIVGHSYGFKSPGSNEFTAENAARITELGGRIYRGTILTHSIETSLGSAFGGSGPTQIIAAALRRIGQGVKVCCEIVMEACDAGLIEEDREVVALAGSGRGTDTVAIIRSKASKRFLELAVLEILAKPRG